jgi:hypothetical protein
MGGFAVRLAERADQLQRAGGGHARLEGAVGGHLVHDAVRQRIGKRQAQLDHIRPDRRQRAHHFQRKFEGGIARRHIGDEGFPVVGFQGGEGVVKAHGRDARLQSHDGKPKFRADFRPRTRHAARKLTRRCFRRPLPSS